MNLRVAQRASLILSGLIMEGWRAGRVCKRRRMARQAEQIHITHLEQMNVGRAVGHVAYGAALGPDWLVLENEGATFIGVAVIASLIFGNRS